MTVRVHLINGPLPPHTPQPTPDGVGAVLVFQDITSSRRLQRQLAHSATHDGLTGLPNRAAFEHALEFAREAGDEGVEAWIRYWLLQVAVFGPAPCERVAARARGAAHRRWRRRQGQGTALVARREVAAGRLHPREVRCQPSPRPARGASTARRPARTTQSSRPVARSSRSPVSFVHTSRGPTIPMKRLKIQHPPPAESDRE